MEKVGAQASLWDISVRSLEGGVTNYSQGGSINGYRGGRSKTHPRGSIVMIKEENENWH